MKTIIGWAFNNRRRFWHKVKELIQCRERRRWTSLHPRTGNHTDGLKSLGFCFLTNIIVTAMLLLGGSAVVNALTGVNIYAASFLIPLGVIVYTLAGGLKATFLASYIHSVIGMLNCWFDLYFSSFNTSYRFVCNSLMELHSFIHFMFCHDNWLNAIQTFYQNLCIFRSAFCMLVGSVPLSVE